MVDRAETVRILDLPALDDFPRRSDFLVVISSEFIKLHEMRWKDCWFDGLLFTPIRPLLLVHAKDVSALFTNVAICIAKGPHKHLLQ